MGMDAAPRQQPCCAPRWQGMPLRAAELYPGCDYALFMLKLQLGCFVVMLISWLVDLVVNPPTDLVDTHGSSALQASAVIAGYSCVVLAIYVVHSGVHLALSYDSTSQLRAFASVMDSGSSMYLRIALFVAAISAIIEVAGPTHVSRSPEMEVTMHATHAASLTDMILRTVWLPISTPKHGGLQPLASRLIPWIWLLGGGVAPMLSYFLDLRVLLATVSVVLILSPFIAVAVTLPLLLGEAPCMCMGRTRGRDMFDEVDPGAPGPNALTHCGPPNLYSVERAPPAQRDSMKGTVHMFKNALLHPLAVSVIAGVLFFMATLWETQCVVDLVSGSRVKEGVRLRGLLPRLNPALREAEVVCRDGPFEGFWSAKRVVSFWFIFASIVAVCAVYCVRLMLVLHTLVQELQNMQQQSAGMLRFLSHECRSPLFVVLLMLNNLVEADMPDIMASVEGGGDASLGPKLAVVSTALTKMQKPLQLLRSVLDNMLSYLKLKQQRRERDRASALPRKQPRMCRRDQKRALTALAGAGKVPCACGSLQAKGACEACSHHGPCMAVSAPLDAGAVMTEIGAMFPVLVDAMECRQPALVSRFTVTGCRCAPCTAAHPAAPGVTLEGGLACLRCLPLMATVQGTTLKQALTNMLTNAVKYGRTEGGAADITVDVNLTMSACPRSTPASPSHGSRGGSGSKVGSGSGSLVLASGGGSLILAAPAPAPGGSEGPPPLRRAGMGTASLEVARASAPSSPQALPCTLSITVADQGKGLSPEDAALLFRPFERLRAGQQQQGTGLGLWLMHELLDFQGGAIAVQSGGVGKGCTFTVSLPCSVEHRVLEWLLDAPSPGHALECVGEGAEPRTVPSKALAGGEPPAPDGKAGPGPGGDSKGVQGGVTPPHVPPSPRPSSSVAANRARPGLTNVLLVDDSRAVLAQLANALKRRDFKVTKAGNGQKALDKVAAASTPFDLIVCDMSMPVMSGPAFARALGDRGGVGTAGEGVGVGMEGPPLPGLKRGTPTIFIGLTGNAMGSDVEEFKSAGAHAVLIKPADPNAIITTATALQTAFVAGQSKATASAAAAEG